jgi:serine/threonine protein kinase
METEHNICPTISSNTKAQFHVVSPTVSGTIVQGSKGGFLKRVYNMTTRSLKTQLKLAYNPGHKEDPATKSADVPVAPVQRSALPSYIFVRELGTGSNGVVLLYKHTQRSQLVAVKEVNFVERFPFDIPREAWIMERAGRHENIVQCYKVMQSSLSPRHKELILEFCDLGDLQDYASSRTFSEDSIWRVTEQIANGLRHLHALKIVHGDFKMENVVLSSGPDAHPTYKIADFGASQLKPPADVPRGHGGTWIYSSPESSQRCGPEQDVWALGVIMHILCYRLYPHRQGMKIGQKHNEWFTQQKLTVPPNTLRPDRYKAFCKFQAEQHFTPCPSPVAPRSRLLNYYVMRCLDKNWEKRITSAELQRSMPMIRKFVEQCKYSDCKALRKICEPDHSIEKGASEASVLQILCAAVDESVAEKHDARAERLFELCNELLGVLTEDDRAKATSYVEFKI